MHQVYYRDRRTNERFVHNQSWQWNGPFEYEGHNWACDGNRSQDIYSDQPHKRVVSVTNQNVIVIEKIVSNGEVVYRQEGIIEGQDSDANDMALARLAGAYDAVSTLQLSLLDRSIALEQVLSAAQYNRQLLSECPQFAEALPIIDRAIAARQTIANLGPNDEFDPPAESLDRCEEEMQAILKKNLADY